VTPAKSASVARPADNKAAKPLLTRRPNLLGRELPPSNQPSRKSRRKERTAMRKRLPRTVAVELAPVEGFETPMLADIMRRAKAEIPNVTATFGIKSVRPKCIATGGLLLEVLGANAAQQANTLASRLRELFPEDPDFAPGEKGGPSYHRVDDSVTHQEIAEAIFNHGPGCSAVDVRVGMIRSSRDSLCTV